MYGKLVILSPKKQRVEAKKNEVTKPVFDHLYFKNNKIYIYP